MKKNGFVSLGAYQWALSEYFRLYGSDQMPLSISLDLNKTIENLKGNGANDCKIMLFETKDYPVIVMTKYGGKTSIYFVKNFDALKKEHEGIISLLFMFGRAEYEENLKKGQAPLPAICIRA